MVSTGAKQAREKVGDPAATASVAPNAATKPHKTEAVTETGTSIVGYGMPCAKCRAYYPADMQTCPICKSRERVSPTDVPPLPTTSAAPPADDAKLLAEERLRALKSQIYASHAQVATTTFLCALDQNHTGSPEAAGICHSCYGELRQHADQMEAALLIDAKEAGKIVYEAVWADTSDPNKTYLNAAAALLAEMRKRAGIDEPLAGKRLSN